MNIKIEKRNVLKEKVHDLHLGFGKFFTDYMFIMDYENGWKNERIIPYQPITLDPGSLIYHYAQETFEGLKAYKNEYDEITLFRPEMNAKRMNASNKRLCMPSIDENDFVEAVKSLVFLEKDWIPPYPNSLYIRPFMIATEASLGVRSSKKYQFIIITSPVSSYYEKGQELIKVYVEDKYVRSVLGGSGSAKCSSNYASSILAQQLANEKGYDQVLWLDGIDRKYIEEVGTMNIFFVIDDEVFTPQLNGSILPGITRDSIIQLLKDKGIRVYEEKIHIDFLMKAIEEKRVSEAFGCGTAALIAPIKQLTYQDKTGVISNEMGLITTLIYDELKAIQWALIEDTRNWILKIKERN